MRYLLGVVLLTSVVVLIIFFFFTCNNTGSWTSGYYLQLFDECIAEPLVVAAPPRTEPVPTKPPAPIPTAPAPLPVMPQPAPVKDEPKSPAVAGDTIINNQYITNKVEGGISESEANQRIFDLIGYINARTAVTPVSYGEFSSVKKRLGVVEKRRGGSHTTSRVSDFDDVTLTGDILLPELTTNALTFVDSAGVLSSADNLIYDGSSLLIGTSTSREVVTVDGAIYISSSTPNSTTDTLYNNSGSLYWSGVLLGSGASSSSSSLASLTDVSLAGLVAGDLLSYNGTDWVNVATSSLGLGGGSASFSNSSQLAALLSDESGTGNVVFSANPTFTGTVTTDGVFGNTATITSASTTNLAATRFNIGGDSVTDLSGSGLLVSSNALTCATGNTSSFGCLLATDWNTFTGKVSTSSIDTSAEISALLTDETGTGALVFATAPTFANMTANGISNLALINASTTNASTTNSLNLNVLGLSTLTSLVATNATVTTLSLVGGLQDSSNAVGTTGQILLSTGTSTRWTSTSSLGISGTAFSNSSQLAALLSDESGTGNVIFSASPTMTGTVTTDNLSGSTATITSATTTNLATTRFNIGGDSIIDLTGTGLISSNGALTISTSTLGLASGFFAQGGNSFNDLAILGTNDDNVLQFETNNVVAMTVATSGNVGIGTTSPTQKLSVSGNALIDGSLSFVQGTSSGIYFPGDNFFANSSWRQMPEKSGIILPMYIYPTNVFSNTDYNNVIDLKKKYHDVPLYVIINPANGPGAVIDGNYVAAIERLKGAGAIVLGYIATHYTASTTDDMENDIDDWLTRYPGIDGIFMDEMTNVVNNANLSYYQTVTRYIHSKGLYPAIGNPGAGVGGEYFASSTADIIVTHENSYYSDEATLAGNYDGGYYDYHYRQRASLVFNVDFSIPSTTLHKKYTGLVYVTDDTLPNPWDSVSPYLEDLFQFLSVENDTFYADTYFNTLVGIGTSTPSAALTVAGDLRVTGRFADSSSSTGSIGNVLTVTASGTAWAATSTLGISSGGASFSNSAQLAAILSDETGTGNVVFSANPNMTGTVTTANLFGTTATITSATTTNFATTRININGDSIIDLTGSGLIVSSNSLTCATANTSTFGCLLAADWNTFTGKVSSSSIDTSTELSALITDETGTGALVFATAPTFVGMTASGVSNFTTLNATTTNASTSNALSLNVTGVSTLASLTTTNATTTNVTVTGALRDSANTAGTLGQILLSTGSSTRWTATSSLGFSGASFSTSAQLAALLSDETGTGAAVFNTGATLSSSSLLGTSYFSGNVGIGTTTPTSQLYISTSSDSFVTPLRIANISSGANAESAFDFSANGKTLRFGIHGTSNLAYIYNTSFGPLAFGTNNTERMQITSSGFVGIGTSSPSAKLTVAGDMRLTGRFGDSSSSTGALGSVLTATANGTAWVATSSLGLGGAAASNFLALTDTDMSSYTANRLIFTNGAATGLTDSTDLIYNGTDFGLGANDGIAFGGTRVISASTSDSIALGRNAGASMEAGGSANVFLGLGAGQNVSNDNAYMNNIIGWGAGMNNTAWQNNIIGKAAGEDNTGSDNNFMGTAAGHDNTGSNNNLFGYGAGGNNTGGWNNVLGYGAGDANSGTGNNIMGYLTGFSNTGDQNNLFGEETGNNNTGWFNNILGSYAGQYNDGDGNNLMGAYTAQYLQSEGSTIIGSYAFRGGAGPAYTANNNTALGFGAGQNAIAAANNNLLLGYQAGFNLISGANNIAIGYDVHLPSATGNGQLTIGNLIFGTGLSATGTTLSTGNIGIGTSTPTAKLTVDGSVRFSDLTGGDLTTDSQGNLTVSSDERLKNVSSMYTGGIETILELQPITFQWNELSGMTRNDINVGFSAQNVLGAIPEAVGEGKDGFLTLTIRPIVAALVNAVKELFGKVTENTEAIEALRLENEALLERVSNLESAVSGEEEPSPATPPPSEPTAPVLPDPEPESENTEDVVVEAPESNTNVEVPLPEQPAEDVTVPGPLLDEPTPEPPYNSESILE